MQSLAGGSDACGRYQDALIDFVDLGEAGPAVGEALAHLERCPDCERELAATALVLTALRRMVEEARAIEASADAWPRLRARVTPRRQRSWAPGPIAGLVTGAALVTALLVGAPQGGRPELGATEYVGDADATPTLSAATAISPFSTAGLNARILRANLQDDPTFTPSVSGVPTLYPDNLRPSSMMDPRAAAAAPTRAFRPD